MVNTVNIKKVVTRGDRVLVHIKKLPKVTESGIITGQTNEFSSTRLDIDNYIGEVIDFGDEQAVHKHSPGLKKGEFAMFSQYAGYHIPTGRDTFAKVIHSHDIHCKVQEPMKFNKEQVTPTGERLLLEVMPPEETTESGIIIGEAEKDPRELDTEKCIVRGVGPQAKEFKVDDVVFIPAYVGNNVVLDDGTELKTVNYNDILFMVVY